MIMDDRTRRMLEAAGHIDRQGIGRRAHARYCRACGRVTMTGADAARCGITVACDPVPLDVLGELRAVMDGLATFDLSFIGGRYEIDRRDQWRIEGNPPCSGNFDVLAEHRCQRYNIAGTSTQFVGADNPANPDGPPPF